MTMNQWADVSCDALTAFILGELSDDEASAFLEHVRTCDNCRAELADLMDVNDRIVTMGEDNDVSLPSDLKERTLHKAFTQRPPVLSRLKGKRKRRTLQFSISAAAILILGIGLGRLSTVSTAPQKDTAVGPAQMLNEIMLKPVDKQTSASGMAMVYQRGHQLDLVVYVEHMKPLDSYECYSVWVKNNGQRKNLGDFMVDRHGYAVLSVDIPTQVAAGSLNVTREPAWGDVVPKGPQVLTPSQRQT